MKNVYKACLGGLLFLSGCASVQGYDTYLNTWMGRSEADLVATWGAPAQMQDLGDGRQILVYMKQKTITEPGFNPENVNFGTNAMYNANNDSLGTPVVYFCKTTFTTMNDIVVNYAWEGDDCVK